MTIRRPIMPEMTRAVDTLFFLLTASKLIINISESDQRGKPLAQKK